MRKRWLNAALAVVLSLTFANTAMAKPSKVKAQGGNNGQAGTTLLVDVTAEGYGSKKTVYDWSINKVSSVQRPVIEPNQTYTVDYSIHSDRTLVSETEEYGVRGTVTVHNGGERPTEGLKLVTRVQAKTGSGAFADLPGAEQVQLPAEQLRPGETKTYPFDFRFTPVDGATYRVAANVTITNHSGYLGQEFGPTPKADFQLPAVPVWVVEDATATLTDSVVCPAGFTCEVTDSGPWSIGSPQTITYTMYPTNVSAACKQIVPLTNTATLTEDTTGQVRTDSNTLLIFTGCCECVQP